MADYIALHKETAWQADYLLCECSKEPRCAGYLFQRVGKIAATAIGGGFLLLQIANHSGYVQVDWKKVEKDVNKAKKHLKKRTKQAAPEINSFFEEVKSACFLLLPLSAGHRVCQEEHCPVQRVCGWIPPGLGLLMALGPIHD
ncbi:FUN14 domain-containing protein 1-like isoform X3 [Oncorhynchus masou masou]|uniref:FUN14 domain-containing protein 1-like isoform X3 n=1 Tax=Oncorhynchus masou masou TaxID=90313 RepID=UPI003183796C